MEQHDYGAGDVKSVVECMPCLQESLSLILGSFLSVIKRVSSSLYLVPLSLDLGSNIGVTVFPIS